MEFVVNMIAIVLPIQTIDKALDSNSTDFWDRFSCVPDWPRALFLMPLSSELSDGGHVVPYLVYMVLGTELCIHARQTFY